MGGGGRSVCADESGQALLDLVGGGMADRQDHGALARDGRQSGEAVDAQGCRLCEAALGGEPADALRGRVRTLSRSVR